eukprot:gene4914-5055_t
MPKLPLTLQFILADDLGFNEMGYQNATRGLHTPTLDRLAHEGVILRNYYVQPMCSPTRSALMTGRYTSRLGTQANVVFWDTPWCPDGNETFLPQNLKDAGYATGMFGKWHLGLFREECLPMHRGFDEFSGTPIPALGKNSDAHLSAFNVITSLCFPGLAMCASSLPCAWRVPQGHLADAQATVTVTSQ